MLCILTDRLSHCKNDIYRHRHALLRGIATRTGQAEALVRKEIGPPASGRGGQRSPHIYLPRRASLPTAPVHVGLEPRVRV